MLPLVVVLALAQAPHTDGRYVPEDVAQRIRADTFDALDVEAGVSFSKRQVVVGWSMESERRSWRWTKAGLEVNGAPVTWRAVDANTVETDARGELERLVFLPGVTRASLSASLEQRRRRAALQVHGGAWRGARRALVIAERPTLDGRAVTLTGVPCRLSCGDEVLCLEVKSRSGSLFLVPAGGRLLEAETEGLCGVGQRGVELVDGGVVLERAAPERDGGP